MIKKIALVETNTDIPNIYTLIATPRLGLPILGNILTQKGYEVDIFSDKIRKPLLNELLTYDIIGISSLTNSSLQGYKYADMLKKHNKTVVIGGPHGTFLPEESLEHCDYVVRGEGEETFIELLDALNNNKSISNIKGISYKKNGQFLHNEDRSFKDDYLNISPDLSLVKGIETFKEGLWNKYLYHPMVYTSRGCPFNCRYCTVIKLAGRKLRYRDLDYCIKDIKEAIKGLSVRKAIMIVDDNFTVDMDRAKNLLKKIIAEKFPEHFLFTIQLKVESFKDEEFLMLLKDAGFGLLHAGFESINKKALNEWHKEQSFQQIKYAVEQAKKYNLKVNGMFIVGSDFDTEETVLNTVDVAMELEVAVMQLFILCPLPGSDIFNQFLSENRLFTFNWKYYDCHHAVFFPKLMKPSVLQKTLLKANKKFYNFNRMFLSNTTGNRITCGTAIYLMEKYQKKYIKKLRKFEDEFYREDGSLIEEKLKNFKKEDLEKYLL